MKGHGDLNRLDLKHAHGRGIVRPGRAGHHQLIARAGNGLERKVNGLHATAGDEVILRVCRNAEQAVVIAPEGFAQGWDTALPGIERFTPGHGLAGGVADELRRGQITFTDPKA